MGKIKTTFVAIWAAAFISFGVSAAATQPQAQPDEPVALPPAVE